LPLRPFIFGQTDPQDLERTMRKISALGMLIACCAAVPATAWASSQTDCSAQWTSADGNKDGVLMGPEADRYLAYYRVRAQVTPADGRISRDDFMRACENDVFMAKALEPGAPMKGANSFTEGQAKDRAMAAGFTSVSSLVKDGDDIWRGSAMKDGKAAKVAIDFKGNVAVTE
jgi:uncharacterized protein with FMN-binding domain